MNFLSKSTVNAFATNWKNVYYSVLMFWECDTLDCFCERLSLYDFYGYRFKDSPTCEHDSFCRHC